MLSKQTAEKMARENILPFWMNMIDRENGGFYGEADYYGKINKASNKGGILNSRILWTFSSAYLLFEDEAYKDYADHAKDFLLSSFYDKENGGIYWLVDSSGKALDTRKQFYNLAFAIYALSEHNLATGDKSSLEMAMSLFDVIEKYGLDTSKGGYIEACSREWKHVEDYRLSGKDLNSPKSMNTNLHVLEAYTTLTIASTNSAVKKALEALFRVTLDKIVNKNWNFDLFFDMDWNSMIKDISYGHDIEGSWLLYEAALATGSKDLIEEVKQAALAIAQVTFDTAIDHKNGGLLSGCTVGDSMADKKILPKKEWWPQAEAVVGFHNAYELSLDHKYLDAANSIWDFIENHYADRENGEWHNELTLDNEKDTKMPKAGFWKCPYHNARACFEIVKRG